MINLYIGYIIETNQPDSKRRPQKHEKGSKFVTMLLENKGGVDTWTPLVDQARTVRRCKQ